MINFEKGQNQIMKLVIFGNFYVFWKYSELPNKQVVGLINEQALNSKVRAAHFLVTV